MNETRIKALLILAATFGALAGGYSLAPVSAYAFGLSGNGTVAQVTAGNGLSVSGGTLAMAAAGAAAAGAVTTGAQTFAGAKTFNGEIISGVASGSAAMSIASGARAYFDGSGGSRYLVYSAGFLEVRGMGLYTPSTNIATGGNFELAGASSNLYSSGTNRAVVIDDTEGLLITKKSLITCSSGQEGLVIPDGASGSAGTYTRLCFCQYDGTTARWRNVITGNTGNTTTCPD